MPRTVDAAVLTEAQKAYNNPIFLFELALSSGTKYFTDDNKDVVFPTGVQTYTSWGVQFDKIKNDVSGEIDRVNIQFDNTDGVFRGYIDTEMNAGYSWQGRKLTIRKVFGNLLSSADYDVIIFVGYTGAPVITEESVGMTLYSPMYFLQRSTPRRRYQLNCHWTFDGTECRGGGASLADEKTGMIADSGTTTTLVDAALTEAENYWQYGTVTMTAGTAANIGHTRQIKSFTAASDTNTFYFPFPSAIATGDEYTIKRGCPKTSQYCRVTFANWTNFGGFSYMPGVEE